MLAPLDTIDLSLDIAVIHYGCGERSFPTTFRKFAWSWLPSKNCRFNPTMLQLASAEKGMVDEYIDSLAATHFLGAKLQTSEKLTGGVSASVTLLDVQLPTGEEIRLVLREHGPSHCGHTAALEFRLLCSLSELGLPVPKPAAWGNADGIVRHPYTLLYYIEGSTDIRDAAAEKHIRIMAAKLANLHDTAIKSLPELPLRMDPRPELLDLLADELEWHGFRSYLTRMKRTAFAGDPVLLHGDYWPKNILWQDETITGILDWEDAAVGDPLSDVACACLELSYLYGDWGSTIVSAHPPFG